MTKIEIENCEQCPHHTTYSVLTPDPFENVRRVHCKLLGKDVHSYLEHYEHSTIPSICPFNEVDSVRDSKWITLEDLKKLVIKRDEFYRSGKSNYASEPKPLFNYNLGSFDYNNNNEFNEHNWCGGDDIIREYMYFISTQEEVSIAEEDCETDKIGFDFICNYNYLNEHQYLNIMVDFYTFEPLNSKRNLDNYIIKVYKSRGKTESILYNGKLIDADQYVILLNIIQATGFEFTAIKELKK